MRFTLTEEQALIQASALDWLAGHYDFRQRQAGVHGDGGSPQAWQSFAELGWLGLPLPDAFGGSGAGLFEAGLLMHAFGRHLVVEPYLACVLQAARLLALAGSAAHQDRWLPAVVQGAHRLALAHAEPGDAVPWSPRRCIAQADGDGWRLDGAKQLVVAAEGAARWLVTAREPGAHGRPVLLLVDPALDGIAVDAYDTTDGRRAADIRFNGVRLEADALVGEPGERTAQLLQQVLAEGVIAQCWEAAGAMQAVLEQTAGYTQQRKQFGQALSDFQVVQHRLAEMAVQCLEAQAACELATLRLDQDAGSGPQVAAIAMSKVGRAARLVSQGAVQLHGAMGVCEELPVAATFRLLLAFTHGGAAPAASALYLGTTSLASGCHQHSLTLGAPA
jgi:alkylation response protein AidB-like acyl-CoA dehydrogenase